MKMNLRALVATGILFVTPANVVSQQLKGGQVELGAFANFTKYDDTGVNLTTKAGAGGLIGLFLTPTFSLEAFNSYNYPSVSGTTSSDVEARVFGGSLLANLAHGAGSFILGAGYQRVAYRGGVASDDNGFHAIVGNRFYLGGRAALRVQGNAAYFSSSSLVPGESKALNLSASAGFSIFAFGGPPRDGDGDGVANRVDQCPDTPMGALVDGVGCPSDSDRDGAWDGLDNCPNTPSGATTDSMGCPSDSDGDGVFNGIDACPNTPNGATVDTNGCPIDSDGDRVFDGLDSCPNTPAGATVDEAGCPTDEDSDGIFDGLDQCPGTPLGTTVDASGCPADTDGDGVLDDADACAATPAGTNVDSRGCRIVVDTDGDGVDDSLDRCPNTTPGRSVDANGCPILFEVTQSGQRAQPLILEGVTFRSGRSELTETSFIVLDQVAASLIANPTVQIEIVGHTDNTGSRRGNQIISGRRAESVRTYLISKGISGSRLVGRGVGPDEPVATNDSAAGRAQNRRVELRLISR